MAWPAPTGSIRWLPTIQAQTAQALERGLAEGSKEKCKPELNGHFTRRIRADANSLTRASLELELGKA